MFLPLCLPLAFAFLCLATTSWLVFILPLHNKRKPIAITNLTSGTRICTYNGLQGTIISNHNNQLSVFLDNGSRTVFLPEQIAKII
jgi:preprotein translocase subunit YajC